MNYIEQINNFWSHTEEEDLTSGDISVYFALLKYNNTLGWIKSFRCDYSVICQFSGVSKNKFYKSIDTLVSHKLITYSKGERNVLKPRISILQLENRKGIIKEQHEEQNEEQREEQKGNLYKLINKETIKLINENSTLVNSSLQKWISSEKKKKRFIPPTLEEIFSYMLETGLERKVAEKESKKCFNHYESNGWKVGKNKMSLWRSAVTGWIGRMDDYKKPEQKKQSTEGPGHRTIRLNQLAKQQMRNGGDTEVQ